MKRIDKLSEEFKIKYEQFIIGCDSAEDIFRWNKDKNGEMDVYFENEILCVIVRLIVSDGEIGEKEVEYLNKNFGFRYTAEDIREMYEGSREELNNGFYGRIKKDVSDLNEIGEKFASAFKELLGIITGIVLESDGYATDSELAEISELKSIIEG